MRCFGLFLFSLMVSGAPSVRAQTVNLKPEALTGLWKGKVVEPGFKRFKGDGMAWKDGVVWKGDTVDRVSSGWLRLQADGLFWQWNTRTIPVGGRTGSRIVVVEQPSEGGIAGRWSLACDTICILQLVHEQRYMLWADAQFHSLKPGKPDTVGTGLLPTVDDSLRWVKQGSSDMLVQQVYRYKVTLANQQLSLVEVGPKLQKTPNLGAVPDHGWLEKATFERQ